MRYLLIPIVLGIVLAGCASEPASKETPPNNPAIANVAPEGKLTEAVPSDVASSLPVMTANPTVIPLTPIQGNNPPSSITNSASTGKWQTFTSAALGVTVNYPSDWSAAEEPEGATFTSPKGATIQLKQGAASPNDQEFKIGNQYCTSRTNQQGQTADVCADNATLTYTATFTLQKADGSTHKVVLLTKTRTVGDVFEAMFNSLQPTR